MMVEELEEEVADMTRPVNRYAYDSFLQPASSAPMQENGNDPNSFFVEGITTDAPDQQNTEEEEKGAGADESLKRDFSGGQNDLTDIVSARLDKALEESSLGLADQTLQPADDAKLVRTQSHFVELTKNGEDMLLDAIDEDSNIMAAKASENVAEDEDEMLI